METPFRALNEFNVLVKIDKVEEKTAGGLIKPPSAVERDKHMAVRATMVWSSAKSFNEDIWDQSIPKPQPGERVLLAKHAGVFMEDDEELKFIKDKDVLAVFA
jgi:co-chaperonin GroES (HSP10)